MSNQMIAVIRIRGTHDIEDSVGKALYLLRLYRKHVCVLFNDTPSIRGQLSKVKDFVTFGTINDETKKLLIAKRGKIYSGRLTDAKEVITYNTLKVDGKNYLPYFNLHPPKGGFERKGIKVAFNAGGVLGDRKDNINELIRKMI